MASEMQKRAMNKEIAKELAMLDRRDQHERDMLAEADREYAAALPSVPFSVSDRNTPFPYFDPIEQVGLLPIPPITYTADGRAIQTPPLGLLEQPKTKSIVSNAIKKGGGLADDRSIKNEQLGFMDKIFGNPILQRMMERALYSTPTMGGNFISEQASGERGLRSVEAEQAERDLKNKIAATAAQVAKNKANAIPKPNATLATLSKSYYKSKQGIDILTQMKNLQTEGKVGGPMAVGENFLNAVLTSIGVNPSESTSDKLSVLRAQLMDSFTFVGRDISAADKAIIEELLPMPGGVTLSEAKFAYALNKLIAKLQNEATFACNSIRNDYGRDCEMYIRQKGPAPKLTVTNKRLVPAPTK